jgi:hypothetical protein
MTRYLAIALLLLAAPVWGATYYIATDGTDPESGCTGGTSESPWRTWRTPYANGCISAGDTVYLKAGTYNSHQEPYFFGGSQGHICTFNGTEEAPVTLAADPVTGGDCPTTCNVKLVGSFDFAGTWGIIKGLEISSDETSLDAISRSVIVGPDGYDLVFENNYIHGSSDDVDITVGTAGAYDCIKTGNGTTVENRRHGYTFRRNKIEHCPQDAIDMTGGYDILIEYNTLNNCQQNNIKGGTEDVTIRYNIWTGGNSGFRSSAMACDGYYCGSPAIPELAVTERFVAKNVQIYNNVFDTFYSAVLGPGGWVDSNIYHNTIVGGGTGLYVQRTGFDFFDSAAATYCTENPTQCSLDCGEGCYRIRNYAASNVNVKNNIFYVTYRSVRHQDNSTGLASGITSTHNVYYDADYSNSFRVDSPAANYSLAQWAGLGFENATNSVFSDPLLSGYYPAANSPAVNAGVNVGVMSDYRGIPRPIGAGVDIGAMEYFSGTHWGGGVTASGVSY